MDEVEVIGLDFGHGDTSVARVFAGFGPPPDGEISSPKPLEIHKKHVQPTAIARDANGNVIIGKPALFQPDGQTIEICFKNRPTAPDFQSELVQTYIRSLYQHLVQTGQISSHSESQRIYIGCPSGWGSEIGLIEIYCDMLNQTDMPQIEVVKESRAALIEMIENNGSPFKLRKVRGSILVIDVGSSTTDFTVIVKREDRPFDRGEALGAATIDRMILEETLKNSGKQAEIEAYFQQNPGAKAKLLYACRECKEEYFSYPVNYETDPYERPYQVNKAMLVTITLDGPTMRCLLNKPLAALSGESWEGRLRRILQELQQQMLAENLPIQIVVLTGGATRMLFLEDITKETFADAEVMRDTNPSTTIALGLARWGRVDFYASSFSAEIEQYKKNKMYNTIAEHIPQLKKAIARTLASLFIKELLKPKICQWREGNISTLESMSAEIARSFEPWYKSKQGTLYFVTSKWLENLLRELQPDIDTIAQKYQIPRGSISLSTAITAIKVTYYDGVDYNSTSLVTIIGYVTAAITRGIGVSLIVLTLPTGPIGIIILAIIEMILVVISPFLGVDGAVPMEKMVLKKNIWVWVRKAGLSEGKIEKMSEKMLDKITNAFEIAMDADPRSMKKKKMQDLIIEAIDMAISERIDQAKLLLL